ncbi:MAG: 1,6-anhydro-N-acetylmuramyl-L-alanine amidase AmpD [Gammaproteobacteria bacterium]|nr:1,6-anhydro-N-acetylmuramyl-L-alanine amidase AmpD [Gammaproteobacteria bacterium]
MIVDHRLSFARQVPSLNCSERPVGTVIDMLVIHNISLPPGQYGGGYVDALFCNRLDAGEHDYFAEIAHLRVSSHLLIDRAGAVSQYVPFNRKAWHAGVSSFCGRENCNDFSIGIELEGTDFEPFTAAQYDQLVSVTGLITAAYPQITLDRIVGHSDVAPGRKTDPGPHFDWRLFKTRCQLTLAHEAGQNA